MKKIVTLLALVLVTSGIFAQGNLTVNSGGSLTVSETSSLTAAGNLTNNGTVTLNSTADDFSSIIVEGTATGDVIYNRYVNAYSASAGGGWDGTGSPVAMSIADFITDNTGVIYQVGDTYALGPFNNLQTNTSIIPLPLGHLQEPTLPQKDILWQLQIQMVLL